MVRIPTMRMSSKKLSTLKKKNKSEILSVKKTLFENKENHKVGLSWLGIVNPEVMCFG